MRLNKQARKLLRDAGIDEAEWARRNYFPDGTWGGDACGCPNSRCIGYHREAFEDCGCLPALLAASDDH